MIGKLRGRVDAIGESELVLDVNGVGYLVGMGGQALARLQQGEEVEIHIETHVREDAFKLWGFLSERERAWFARLQLIQGVGAKAALAVLDALGVNELESAAALGDASAFGQAKGVGPKLAGRLALELKDKPPPVGRSFAPGFSVSATAGIASADQAVVNNSGNAAREEAVSALTNLGYAETDARRAAAAASRANPEAETGDLIRLALKELAK
ncbi:Holliday junction branch migration protein RuvA [Hyphobacterium sp. HN65]|uniref:Holliday junction branch migration complex subunit RuvA n=1 Tax=Hyphobacterium lacteum TaxID=3116575 RepID=A0ABU7LPR7_9PROT|nr:Holliday junction branch migration protein RuvA [Hyphobacterium sp. HN65]MEE2525903.1 Holliday junction branch migration protein RuvA [Hyphobacterium sp. HN65]